MKWSLRPTTSADSFLVRQFLRLAFETRHDAPAWDPSVMAWKYWDLRNDWDGPRSYVLERDGVIVAHAGIYPLTFDQGRIRGVQMIDWASSREWPGAGLSLLKELDSMFDFIYSIGGSPRTREVLPAFGFVECAKQWNGARPLRPLQQILEHQLRDWKLAPRLFRNALWAASKAEPLSEGWKSEQIGPNQVSDGFHSQSMESLIFSPRSPDFFEYLLRCPVMPIRLYGICDDRGPQGHFTVGILRGQARVGGIWLRNPDREKWKSAFSLARKAATQLEGAHEIAAAGTSGPSEDGAVRSGLHIVRHTPVYLLNKKGKLTLTPDFQFQLSDNDGLFLDHGVSGYWT